MPREVHQAAAVCAEAGGVRLTVYHSEPGHLFKLGSTLLSADDAERLLADLERVLARLRGR